MEVIDRARAYVEKMEGAQSGAGGHDRTFAVACVLVDGFALGEADAMRVLLEYNKRCDPPWSERELHHKVASAMRTAGQSGHLLKTYERRAMGAASAPSPASQPKKKPKRPEYDEAKLAAFVKSAPPVDEEDFRAASRVGLPREQGGEVAEAFLNCCYEGGERVLIFTSEMSQGQFLYEVGRGLFQLGKKPTEKAKPANVWPLGGANGVFFLAAPVTGSWEKLGAKLSRRSGASVTSWRWMVLESDDAPPELWLKFLSMVQLPIAAIYSSGGKSYHALIRVNARTKGEWDMIRDKLLYPLLCPLGGDGAAMSAVRLTRLPGMMRRGARGKDGEISFYSAPRLQRLIYLDPKANPLGPRVKGGIRG